MTRKHVLLAITSLFLLNARPEPASRPGWENPPNGVRLESRDVIADPALPLPRAGEAVYLFTSRALTRPELSRLDRAGLRYLGVVATHVYTFLIERTVNDARDVLLASGVRGTSAVLITDRLDLDVAAALGKDRLPLPLRVGFYPRTTRREVLALVPNAAERMRLPRDADEAVREERHLLIPWGEATPSLLRALAESPFVGRVSFDHPRVTTNAASRALSNADQIIAAPLSLSGNGVVVGHWDGGAVSTGHQDFGGRVTNYENGGTDSHATHTAGTVLGSGAGNSDARGYATAATMVAYDFYGDPPTERRVAKHAHYHQHDNHSWGSDSGSFGGYDDLAATFDEDGRGDLLMAIKSAGNDGQRSEVVDQNYGFDSLSGDSTGKNVMVIGATQDGGDLASFSSRGPTNDGRMKPDLSANGDNLVSPVPGGGYDSYSGTSMSAPSVTGMLALLSELYQRQYGHRWATDEIRAVMLHTVIDVFHQGPDYRHGWGNADARAAATLLEQDAANPGTQLARGAVRENETLEYSIVVPAGAPEVKVTMTWLDSNANSTASRVVVHDLDLLLIDPAGASHYPWTLDPANPFTNATRDKKNSLDNIEQVLVENPAAGTWTVRVTGTAVTDPDLDVQGYVIASSHPLSRGVERVNATMGPGGIAIPDGNMAGATINFDITEQRPVRAVRLVMELRAPERGQIRVELRHPDGTMSLLEGEDTSTRRDLYTVYPDLRSYNDDTIMFAGKAGAGTWSATIIDTAAGGDATLLGAMLEIEIDATLPPPNDAPIANAGADQAVNAGDAVALDGSLSSDPEGQPLVFAWTQVSGTPVMLAGADTAQPTFDAPAATADEQLVFRLTVTDAGSASAIDDVLVNVKGVAMPMPNNMIPVARISAPTMAAPGDRVELDASGSSDPDGDTLSFSWTQSGGQEVALDSVSAAKVAFIAPQTSEMIMIALRVEVADGRGGSDFEDAVIMVAPGAVLDPPMMQPMNPANDARPNGVVTGTCVCSHHETAEFDPSALFALVALAFALRLRSRSF